MNLEAWWKPDAPPEHAARRQDRQWAAALLFLATTMVGVLLVGGLLAGTSEGGTASDEALRQSLWIQNAYNAIAMLALPLAWVILTRQDWDGVLDYLRLRNLGKQLGVGLLLTVAIFVALIVLGIIIDATAPELGENPAVDTIVRIMTWPLVIVTSLVAGIAEEVYFRGVLQRQIGILGQAVLFGLVHAGYGTPLQIILPLVLGIVFGFVHRKHGLLAVIVAHFLFDFIQLSAALAFGHLAPS